MFLYEGSAGWKNCREGKKEATEGRTKPFGKDSCNYADCAAKNKAQSEFPPFRPSQRVQVQCNSHCYHRKNNAKPARAAKSQSTITPIVTGAAGSLWRSINWQHTHE